MVFQNQSLINELASSQSSKFRKSHTGPNYEGSEITTIEFVILDHEISKRRKGAEYLRKGFTMEALIKTKSKLVFRFKIKQTRLSMRFILQLSLS